MRLMTGGCLLLAAAFSTTAEPLGWFEQRFSAINFDPHKWSRTAEQSCRVYTAQEDASKVEVLRIGTNNLVAFRASKGLKITICGSTAAFDEGFEALGSVDQKPVR